MVAHPQSATDGGVFILKFWLCHARVHCRPWGHSLWSWMATA